MFRLSRMNLSVLIGGVLLKLCSAFVDDVSVVNTKYGPIEGKLEAGSYYAYKGIPYAKPPIGNLRFKEPQEPDPWTEVLKVHKDAPSCLQKNYLFANPKVEGSEDCLYLNVYVPKALHKLRKITGWDFQIHVMVFIHWGGFFTGYSSSDYLGPEYLMKRGIILVTFNYRLGVFGFLSTFDDVAPGNYALKDQVAVLKWVQENIQNFGGLKEQVTIFGQSAGGASVHLHMFSPESKHLFHRAISQSGTALSLWAKPLQGKPIIANIQARLMGCQDLTNSSQIIKCLRKVDAKDLVNSGDKFKFFSVDPLTVYLPSIEIKTHNNPHPFITKQPIEYIRNREFNGVPWIIGVVQDEGLIRAAPIIRQKQTRMELNENFDILMPRLMQLEFSTHPRNVKQLWKKIKDFYFNNKNAIDIQDNSTIRSLINIYSDRAFVYSAYQTALFHSIKGHENIWFYNFNYTGKYSYGNVFAATNENINYTWGVSHCDELLYLFKTPALFPDLDGVDAMMKEFMTLLWASFAKFGKPCSFSSTETWFRLNNSLQGNLSKEISFIDIYGNYEGEGKVVAKYGFYTDRLKFWEDIPLFENIPELEQWNLSIP